MRMHIKNTIQQIIDIFAYTAVHNILYIMFSICPYHYVQIWQSADMSHIAWSNKASRMHYAGTARKSITLYK